jgi:hypothetical protein
MIRNNCIICESTNSFIEIYNEFTPLCLVPTDEDVSTDLFGNITYIGCKKCGAIQLKTLIDPEILYKKSHNGCTTGTWCAHHTMFADFILDGIDKNIQNNFLEIGGNVGILAKIFKEKTLSTNFKYEYSILDMCEETINIDGINYIQGNCETYENYQYNATVIMSHTFEHLYNPVKFVKQISVKKVKEIFISNPNMDSMLENDEISFINIEHTFYCNNSLLIKLFEYYGYICVKTINFKIHSTFYHFKMDETKTEMRSKDMVYDADSGSVTNGIVNIYDTDLIPTFKNYFKKREDIIKSFEIKEPFYICPGGHYGQTVYRFLSEETRKNVLGFLDADETKLGKRNYGTPLYTFKRNKIQEYGNNPITVLLFSINQYLEEISKELYKFNENVQVLTCLSNKN